ncbi:probable plastid-lipid-associated protein 4, chloroplastic [Andrographis paniculata]|uniref:probable plastid-lipid-associated protein 4, chloroplastic n=1 Tax=Andrographis paniculata TaxID=175694 RepID=UPI0021E7E75C|nr:probable plastid-lipid-associated protein 4, chloroplastic [Andrographis paniculata]
MAVARFSSAALLNNPIDFYPASASISVSSSSVLRPSTHTKRFSCAAAGLNLKSSQKWRIEASFFSSFLDKSTEIESLKTSLLEAIAPLDRGAAATPEDQQLIDQIARKLEALNKVKEPLKSNLLNGKWELLYTTSKSILQPERPKFLRPNGKIYQAINVDTLRAQNMETWPFFNQATANLVPLNACRVAVKFDSFKVAALIPIKSRGSGRGQLEITYLDEELRISRGNEGNLFILKMVDPLYRVPL